MQTAIPSSVTPRQDTRLSWPASTPAHTQPGGQRVHSLRFHRQYVPYNKKKGENVSRILQSVLRIRIRSDPKLDAGSGSGKNHSGSEQLRIRNEFEVKLLWETGKIWTFLNKNAKFKSNYFFAQPNTLTRQEYKGKICFRNTKVKFFSGILEQIYVGSETGSGSNWKVVFWIRQKSFWINLSCRIRIRIQQDIFLTKIEKVKKFHVLKCWMFSFEGWRLLL